MSTTLTKNINKLKVIGMEEHKKVTNLSYYKNIRNKKAIENYKSGKVKIYNNELKVIFQAIEAKKTFLMSKIKETKERNLEDSISDLLEIKLDLVKSLISNLEIATRSNFSDFDSYFWKYDNNESFIISLNLYEINLFLECIKDNIEYYYETNGCKVKERSIMKLENVQKKLKHLYLKLKSKA